MSNNINFKNSVTMKKTTWRIFKKNGFVLNSCAAATIMFAATGSFADNVLPTGGAYASGTGTIGTAGNDMTINQSTTNGIINWGSFSIGSDNIVQINNGTGATMNRVNVGGPLSQINGQLRSTGSTYLINQNGVVVGPQGQITTGGSFVASTRDISDADFNNGGANTYSGTSANGVVNNGTISAGGDVILVGKYVNNAGTITAGKDALIGAGDQILLTDTGINAGTRMHVAVGEGSIENSGSVDAVNAELRANGGNIFALAINNTGRVKAKGLSSTAGRLVLSSAGGNVQNSGTLDASSNGGAGAGLVDIYSAKDINLKSGTNINTGVNGRFTANAASPASVFAAANNSGEQAFASDWRAGTGTINFDNNVNIKSDGLILNSGKTAGGDRTDLGTNVSLKSSGGTHGAIAINGFKNVDLNNEGTNQKLTTNGSVIVNAKNINIDEDLQVKGDLVLNAAAFDDNTNNFVQGRPGLFSDGWIDNHGELLFTKNGGSELSICCGVTLTSGLDNNGQRTSDILNTTARFSYNNETNRYSWYEVKGFDQFDTTFEGGKLTSHDSALPTQNGFITLINNDNFINFNAQATNDILVIANNDTIVSDNIVTAGKKLTFVVDENTPLAAGPGSLVVSRGASLNGSTIAMFTSRQGQNSIEGSINGTTFAPGTEFLNTAQEEWVVFYQNADAAHLAGQNPLVVYYKNQQLPGRPDCSANPSQAGCDSTITSAEDSKEYRVLLTQDNTAPEEGALAYGSSADVRRGEVFSLQGSNVNYTGSFMTESEKISTFWYSLPIEAVNLTLSGLTVIPGLEGVAEGMKGVTGGVGSALDTVFTR